MVESNDYDLKPEPKPAAPGAVPKEPAAPAAPPPAVLTKTRQAQEASAEDTADIRQNKGMALLAYLGILVVIPMVFGQHSKFVRHHLNQGLLLFVLEAVAWVGCKVIMLLGYPLLHLHAMVYLTSLIGGLIWLAFGLLSLLGLLHVAGGSFANLPVIGEYEVINLQGSED
ncbi:MAG: hypothetical protein ACP5I8_00410 [Phycisphaerae bacterium]